MRVAVHANHSDHQQYYASVFARGLRSHGVEVVPAAFNAPVACDAAVIWGWRQPRVAQSGVPVLVMERGHLQDRNAWVSCGWDGLGGRARYPTPEDGGERWRQHWGELRPWCCGNFALLLGQVSGDASLQPMGVPFDVWAQRQTEELRSLGWFVRYRPHPLASRAFCPAGATLATGALGDALAGAGLAVTFNSTSGIEAVLAGVPTVAIDRGSMAWPVAAHRVPAVDEQPYCPDRAHWAHDLAWCQWGEEEIANGTAWNYLQEIQHVSHH